MRTPSLNPRMSIWGLAIGYFLFYVPYSAMTKALSKGLLPGTTGPISGFEMLPTVVVGTFFMFLILITVMRWWKYATFHEVGGLKIPFASNRWTIFSGIATAFIIITTTLAYSFTGISIVFAALLMRGGVLVMSPFIDSLFNRKVHWYSWAALALSLAALLMIFAEKGGYVLTIAATLNIAAYLSGYFFRLQFMTKVAKTVDRETNYHYFVEEMLVAGVAILVLPLIWAATGLGSVGLSLQLGWTTFITSTLAMPALVIGVLYACLYIFGTRIYLDYRENTYCIPFNRCASLLAGVTAASILSVVFAESFVSTVQLLSSSMLIVAILFLSYPALRQRKALSSLTIPGSIVFVCPGNTGRSPMAQAICQAEMESILRQKGVDIRGLPVKISSAGISAKPGKPISPEAAKALENLGLPQLPHESRNITPELMAEADFIYCMSNEHKEIIESQYPDADGKVFCLDPEDRIPVPHGQGVHAFRNCATYLQGLIRQQLEYKLSTA